jgi:hypothetical protein
VRAEPIPEADPNRNPVIKAGREGAIKETLTIRMLVDAIPFGTLPRVEEEWLDLRSKE